MKNISFEKISYYISSMILFNLFYIVKILSIADSFILFENNLINVNVLCQYICLGLPTFFVLYGIIYCIILFKNDFTPNNGEKGVKLNVIYKENITSNEFLGKFSLLILTGLTIGGIPNWYGLGIYIFFFLVIGFIFIRFNMFYLNPILIIFGYQIFKCKGFIEKQEKEYYIVTNKNDFEKYDVITFTVTNKKIIRLNKNNEPSNKNEN